MFSAPSSATISAKLSALIAKMRTKQDMQNAKSYANSVVNNVKSIDLARANALKSISGNYAEIKRGIRLPDGSTFAVGSITIEALILALSLPISIDKT